MHHVGHLPRICCLRCPRRIFSNPVPNYVKQLVYLVPTILWRRNRLAKREHRNTVERFHINKGTKCNKLRMKAHTIECHFSKHTTTQPTDDHAIHNRLRRSTSYQKVRKHLRLNLYCYRCIGIETRSRHWYFYVGTINFGAWGGVVVKVLSY